jgi:hypothetical protein
MRWLKVAVPVVALGVLAASVASANVPSFVRQTGLTCNQCHMTWTPNPDMTFTGTKFRLNGYRTPWVAEKIEAGEEGALNGRRLVLSVTGYLSFHMRSLMLTQSKPNSNPAVAEPRANAVTTQPFQSLAWDFTGPITENVGIWTEWYSTQTTTATGNRFGLVDNDEYDVKMTFNPGDGGNIIGFGINNQPLTSPFFGAFGSGVSSNLGTIVHLETHAWIKDRAALSLIVTPGQDNYDYRRMNYGGTLALLPMNTDAMWLMVTVTGLAGNDLVPMISSSGFSLANGYGSPGASTVSYSDAVRGVSATRGGLGSYSAANTGDGTRVMADIRFGFLDKGSWSANTATGFSFQNETYSDGASTKLRAFATSWRIFYERTYGLLFNVGKRLTYEFTDVNGIVHDIPDDLSFGAGFVFRQAMNFAWELQVANSQSLTLDQNWRNGWSWNLRWHFLY